jgi:hypothetical protein
MDINALAIILQTTIGLVVLCIVFVWLWPAVRLDAFRQNLFAVRDELFDYAASGRIPFQHPAYRLLRQSMNGFIRYAHRISVFQIAMTLLMWKATQVVEPEYGWTKKWENALASIEDDGVKEQLKEFHNRVAVMVAERIVLGSPLLIVFLIVCLVADLCQQGWKSVHQTFRQAVVEAASRAVDPRRLEEEAMKAAA